MENIVVNGHREKLVKELRAAADAIAAGKNDAYIDVDIDSDGNVTSNTSIEFTVDNEEFGLEDRPYVEIGD